MTGEDRKREKKMKKKRRIARKNKKGKEVEDERENIYGSENGQQEGVRNFTKPKHKRKIRN